MTYFFPYFQEAIMMNVCSCLEKLFFSVTKGAAAAGRIVCLILGQPKPIGNYNTMGRSLEQKPIHHKVQERWRGHGTHTHTFLVDAGGRNIVGSIQRFLKSFLLE